MATITNFTAVPNGYLSDYKAAGLTNPTNGYANTSSSNYATIKLTTGSSAETYVDYTFDLSGIPSNAVILTVVCSVKAYVSTTSSSYINTNNAQLYSGTTAKGTASSAFTTSASTLGIDGGSWTREELNNLKLRLYAKRGTSSTSTARYFYFYGADLTIQYTTPTTITTTIPIVGNAIIGGINQTISSGKVNVGGTLRSIVESYENIGGIWKPSWTTTTNTESITCHKWKKYNANKTTTADSVGWSTSTTRLKSVRNYVDDARIIVASDVKLGEYNSDQMIIPQSGWGNGSFVRWDESNEQFYTIFNYSDTRYEYALLHGYRFYQSTDGASTSNHAHLLDAWKYTSNNQYFEPTDFDYRLRAGIRSDNTDSYVEKLITFDNTNNTKYDTGLFVKVANVDFTGDPSAYQNITNLYIDVYFPEFVAGTTTYSQGSTYYGEVAGLTSNAYPTNGRHSDGYWYVYVGSETITPPSDSGSTDLPSGYTQLQYIESNGTQYIDTGFKPNQDTRVVCEFMYGSEGYVFGAEKAYKNNSFDLYTRLAVYNTTSYTFTALSTTSKHIADFNKNVLSINGNTVRTFTYTTFASDLPLFLFCVNSGGSGIEGVKDGRIYSCQIYDNGTIVRDFVPCQNPSGIVGLYDIVNSKFYTNSGTGTFTAG